VKNLEFDCCLRPYDFYYYRDWKHIYNYITKDVIERIEPIGGEIIIMSESELIEKGSQTVADKHLAKHLLEAQECYEHNSTSPWKTMSNSQ